MPRSPHHRESTEGREGGNGASLAAEPIPSHGVSSWPKRDDAVVALGRSKSTVRRLEASGVLVAVRDEAGATRIDPQSLARAQRELGASPQARPQPIARHVDTDEARGAGPTWGAPERRSTSSSKEPEIFAALSAGRSPVQVVVELGVTSVEVEAAMAAWARLMGPWEPPVSVAVAHLEAITAFARDLQASVVALDARVAGLETALVRLTSERAAT